MKWVKFKDEFYDGTLNRFRKNDDKLIRLGEAPGHTYEPVIVVSEHHNYILDNSFRIYESNPDRFKEVYINGEPDSYKKLAYRRWHYASGLPAEYFDITYFDDAFIAKNCEYLIANVTDRNLFLLRREEYLHKISEEKSRKEEYEQEYLKEVYGAKPYPRPHPFEIYCGGWVDFFDEQVRRGDTDHALYFDWHCKERAVSVYKLQTKPVTSTNISVNVNVTNPPTSSDPPPPPPGKPPC